MSTRVRACAIAAAVFFGSSTRADAQSGDGSTTSTVLSLPAGSRAAALGGAYVGARDVDVLFYNPAGAAWLHGAASMSVQRHVQDMTYASVAAAARVGRLNMGVTVGYFDFGSVAVVKPDPAFGGQRGQPTGDRVDAGEAIVRIVAATAFRDRASIGVSAGVLYTSLAETGRPAALFDVGAQYVLLRHLTAGAALRNAGADVSGAGLASAPLPTELRIGLTHAGVNRLFAGATARLHADVVANLATDRIAPAGGLEISAPVALGATGAVRLGYDGTASQDAIGRLHVGAGLVFGRVAVDYAVQRMDPLGTAHRFGVRWSPHSRSPPPR